MAIEQWFAASSAANTGGTVGSRQRDCWKISREDHGGVLAARLDGVGGRLLRMVVPTENISGS